MTPSLHHHSITPTPKRVFGYVRGSTEEQQLTLEAQENQIRAYCEYKGLELVKVFIESGESGSTSFYERPVAAAMLAAVTEPDSRFTDHDSRLPISGIVITKLDRGFRNALDCLFTLENLERRGIGLHLLDIQLDPDTPVGKLLVTMLAAIAEFENKRRSERQVAAFAVLKGQGKRCGAIPYGWDMVESPESAALVSNEEEQIVLAQIVHWKEKDHYPISKIARFLNNAGTPTKNGGKKWFPATVASVYKHRRLAAPLPTSKAA